MSIKIKEKGKTEKFLRRNFLLFVGINKTLLNFSPS